MQSDLYSNAVMKADAREGINARLIGMDVDQSKDESQREKDMLEARAKSMKSGFKGVGQFASSVGYLQPLFGGKAITQLEQEQLDTLAKANTGIWGDNSGS
jgi:hypothetical protein